MVLVVVLWLIALLAVMAVSQTAATRTETVMVGNALEVAAARHAAQAGIQLALLDRYRDPGQRLWRADGTLYPVAYGDTRLWVAVEDEAGKVDLNGASGPLLQALFAGAGVDEEEAARLADAVLDWRDPDDLRRLNGAEQDDYAAAGLPYGPRNGPFRSLDELALVLGMTPALYQTVAGSITLYSGSRGFDPLVAPEAVLRLLPGLGAGELDAFLTLRAAGDAPEDYFGGAGEGVTELLQSRGGGRAFTFYCEALRPSGISQRIAAVVRPSPRGAATPGAYEILAWREDVPRRAPPPEEGGADPAPRL